MILLRCLQLYNLHVKKAYCWRLCKAFGSKLDWNISRVLKYTYFYCGWRKWFIPEGNRLNTIESIFSQNLILAIVRWHGLWPIMVSPPLSCVKRVDLLIWESCFFVRPSGQGFEWNWASLVFQSDLCAPRSPLILSFKYKEFQMCANFVFRI